jgi:hypothetical protein
MASVLQKHREQLGDRHRATRDSQMDSLIMPRFSGNPPKVNLVTREGRPAIKFIDVGSKFVDVKDRLKRIKEGERRRRLKEKKREKAEMKDRTKIANVL